MDVVVVPGFAVLRDELAALLLRHFSCLRSFRSLRRGSRLEVAYFVLARQTKSVSARSSSARRRAIRLREPPSLGSSRPHHPPSQNQVIGLRSRRFSRA